MGNTLMGAGVFGYRPPVAWALPNAYDDCLVRRRRAMAHLEQCGGLQKLCCPAAVSGDNPPWTVMPPEGRRYQQIGDLTVASLTETVETNILSFRVPTGYDGVIVAHLNLANTGFPLVEGSGDITWRIRLSRRYLKDYGNITTTLGSLASPIALYRGGVRLFSDQWIYYTVTLAAGAKGRLGDGRIFAGLFGWWYPMTR